MAELFCVQRHCEAFAEEDVRLHDEIDERTADLMMQNRGVTCDQLGKCSLRSIDEVPTDDKEWLAQQIALGKTSGWTQDDMRRASRFSIRDEQGKLTPVVHVVSTTPEGGQNA